MMYELISFFVLVVIHWYVEPMVRNYTALHYTLIPSLVYHIVLYVVLGGVLALVLRRKREGSIPTVFWYASVAVVFVITIVRIVIYGTADMLLLTFAGIAIVESMPHKETK